MVRIKATTGRRRPYLLAGALLSALALWAFPNSAGITEWLGNLVGINLPVWSALLFAAIMIWILHMLVGVISDFFLSFASIY